MEELLKQALKNQDLSLFTQLMNQFPLELIEDELSLLPPKLQEKYKILYEQWAASENLPFWDKINKLPTGIFSLDPDIPQFAFVAYPTFNEGDTVTLKGNERKATVIRTYGKGIKVRFLDNNAEEWYFAVQFFNSN